MTLQQTNVWKSFIENTWFFVIEKLWNICKIWLVTLTALFFIWRLIHWFFYFAMWIWICDQLHIQSNPSSEKIILLFWLEVVKNSRTWKFKFWLLINLDRRDTCWDVLGQTCHECLLRVQQRPSQNLDLRPSMDLHMVITQQLLTFHHYGKGQFA